MSKEVARKIVEMAAAQAELAADQKRAEQVMAWKQFNELKKTNPHAAALMVNASGHDIYAGRDLAAEAEKAAKATEIASAVDAAIAATKPNPTGGTPAPAPAA